MQNNRWSVWAFFAVSFVLVGYHADPGVDAGLPMDNACPTIERFLVSPMRAALGQDVTVSVTASDADGDAIAYQWAATAGTFTDASAGSTTYRCGADGPQSITVTVSDTQACATSQTAQVTCVE